MTDTVTDEKLSELAEALAVNRNLPTLGLKIRFRQTTNMLFNWKTKTPRAKQIPDLVKALNGSGLVEFADEFFPEGVARQVKVPMETPSTSASNVGSKSSSGTGNFEKRFKKPATLTIPHCAMVTAPNKIQTVLYSWNQAAILVIILLTWAAVSVSGTTPELSTTTSDTVNIPCLFGEGTVRNIFWSYSGGTGRHKILFLADGNLYKEAEYANRASLRGDNSTLILKEITVADEGTYHCDVDRQGQTVVPNVRTKLNVFSLRPDTLPLISPCTGAHESSPCSIQANHSFTLTSTLPNVYPVEDTELIWYQDGKRVSSTDNVTQNDDGTIDISRKIQVSETGNFTCNATYLIANGKENTAVSVEVWIISPADVPNTPRPGESVTSGRIAGMIMGIVLLVGISLAISKLLIYRSKARVPTTKELKPPETSEVNGSKDEKAADSWKLLEMSTENGSKYEDVECLNIRQPSTIKQRNVNRIVSEKEFLNLSMLIAPSYYNKVGINLDISIEELGQIKEGSQNTTDALMTVFMRWRDKQSPGTDIRSLLAKELERSDLVSLSGKLLDGRLVPMQTAPTTSGATGTPPPYGRMDARYLDGTNSGLGAFQDNFSA